MPVYDSSGGTQNNSSTDSGSNSSWIAEIGNWVVDHIGLLKGSTEHFSWEEANQIALTTARQYMDYLYSHYTHDQVNYTLCDYLRTITADWIASCVNGIRWADHKDQDNYRYVAALRGEPYVNVTPTNWDSLRGKDDYLKTIFWLHFMWLLENVDKNSPTEFATLVKYDLDNKTLQPALQKVGLTNTPVTSTPVAPILNTGGSQGTGGSPVGGGVIPTNQNTSPVTQILQGNVGPIVAIILVIIVISSFWKGK